MQNTSWGRRGQRGSISNGNSPLPGPRGSNPPTPQQASLTYGTSPGEASSAPPVTFTPQSGVGVSESAESYGPVEVVNVDNLYGTSPPRDTPFMRQNGIGLTAVPSIDPAQQAANPSGVTPMTRTGSFAYSNPPQDTPLSPFRRQTSALPGNLTAAMQEEKDEGSVRSKRHHILTTPTAPATTALNPSGYNLNTVSNNLHGTANGQGRAQEATSPYGRSPPPRGSPYTGSYSPNLSNLVRTGERRNGVPVTTVNLGYSSGIKRGASFRDTANSPKKN